MSEAINVDDEEFGLRCVPRGTVGELARQGESFKRSLAKHGVLRGLRHDRIVSHFGGKESFGLVVAEVFLESRRVEFDLALDLFRGNFRQEGVEFRRTGKFDLLSIQ